MVKGQERETKGKKLFIGKSNYSGTSKGMEGEGFRRCMDWLDEKGLLPQVVSFTGDQDSSVHKVLQTDPRFKHITYENDLLHVKRNLRNDLIKILGQGKYAVLLRERICHSFVYCVKETVMMYPDDQEKRNAEYEARMEFFGPHYFDQECKFGCWCRYAWSLTFEKMDYQEENPLVGWLSCELQEYIFGYLTPKDICSITSTCQLLFLVGRHLRTLRHPNSDYEEEGDENDEDEEADEDNEDDEDEDDKDDHNNEDDNNEDDEEVGENEEGEKKITEERTGEKEKEAEPTYPKREKAWLVQINRSNPKWTEKIRKVEEAFKQLAKRGREFVHPRNTCGNENLWSSRARDAPKDQHYTVTYRVRSQLSTLRRNLGGQAAMMRFLLRALKIPISATMEHSLNRQEAQIQREKQRKRSRAYIKRKGELGRKRKLRAEEEKKISKKRRDTYASKAEKSILVEMTNTTPANPPQTQSRKRKEKESEGDKGEEITDVEVLKTLKGNGLSQQCTLRKMKDDIPRR